MRNITAKVSIWGNTPKRAPPFLRHAAQISAGAAQGGAGFSPAGCCKYGGNVVSLHCVGAGVSRLCVQRETPFPPPMQAYIGFRRRLYWPSLTPILAFADTYIGLRRDVAPRGLGRCASGAGMPWTMSANTAPNVHSDRRHCSPRRQAPLRAGGRLVRRSGALPPPRHVPLRMSSRPPARLFVPLGTLF